MRLSNQQLNQFEDQGYLFFPELFSENEMQTLLDEVPKLMTRQTNDNLKEKTGTFRQLYNSHRDSAPFKALSRHPRILEGVHQILGGKVYIWHSKINVKESFEGTVWHGWQERVRL